MSKEKFVTIGHIVNDIVPTEHLGGGVSYAAVTAKRLGYPTYIVTKCSPEHKYVKYLKSLGINVHVLHSKSSDITTFANYYDQNGNRNQISPKQQEIITVEDIAAIPEEIFKGSSILIAPVVGEVDTQIFPLLSKLGSLFVTPQGYLRNIETNGTVTQKAWDFPKEDLQFAKTIILSGEDLTINSEVDDALLDKLVQTVPTTVVTLGCLGSVIFSDSKKYKIDAYTLKESEVKDPTGAGDTFASAFITEQQKGIDLKESASFASLFTAIKIMAISGKGTNSVPTIEQFYAYSSKNRFRTSEYILSQL